MKIISYKQLNNTLEIEYIDKGIKLIYKSPLTVYNSKFSNLIKLISNGQQDIRFY
jgi:hypothetical protein